MNQIRQVAVECVGRAVMFGWLAIGCVMVGFSFAPVSSFRSGAVLALIMSLILLWRAMTAASRNPRHSEVWLYLDEVNRPAETDARFVFTTIMREVYGHYAQVTLWVAVGLFGASALLQLGGLTPYSPPTVG
ncbi:hypothetical protein [Mesorhizobium sp. J428]|uniref:hypothetical protein n=1 Tax=Mesorhizobium sp. J428 TaxID=2898440 RepID=UPI002150A9E3|nr:hypothetical protein [Mesorhizobium sp. J428]MCR5858359.1 hypothetical protein [Mesorhizobium sp. J428]